MRAPQSVEEFERLAHEYEDAGDYHLADYARSKARSIAFRNRFRIRWRAEWQALKRVGLAVFSLVFLISAQIFVDDWFHGEQRAQLAHLRSELDLRKSRLDNEETGLRELNSRLTLALSRLDRRSQAAIEDNNDLVGKYDADVVSYKQDVNAYNSLVKKINTLAKQSQGEPLRVPLRVRW